MHLRRVCFLYVAISSLSIYNISRDTHMASLETLAAEVPPLQKDETGTIRVGGTRVTLETVVQAWQGGETEREIVEAYDVLTLAQVYAVISYSLNHPIEIRDYLGRQQRVAEEIQIKIESQFPPQALRVRLLARQSSEHTV